MTMMTQQLRPYPASDPLVLQDERTSPLEKKKPKVYVAGPFFNDPQRKMICRICGILTRIGYPYYSPMIDSGSHLLTPEQRKDPKAWDPIYESNISELHKCGLILACISYPMLPQQGLYQVQMGGESSCFSCRVDLGPRVELPDTGVTFEMGYAACLRVLGRGGLCVSFALELDPKKLNLMLMKGSNGLIVGYEKLEKFLRGSVKNVIHDEYEVSQFDWSVAIRPEGEVE